MEGGGPKGEGLEGGPEGCCPTLRNGGWAPEGRGPRRVGPRRVGGPKFHFKVALLSRVHLFVLVFRFLCIPRQTSMGRRGWQAIEVLQGWFNVICGPRPPSVRWPQAQSSRQPVKVVRNASATPAQVSVGRSPFSARSSSQEWSSSHSTGGHGACTPPCNPVGVSHAVVGCRRSRVGSSKKLSRRPKRKPTGSGLAHGQTTFPCRLWCPQS